MLNIIYPILVGLLIAVMDRTSEEVAYNNSVFRNLNRKWWLKSVSWEYVNFLPFTKYRPDAWHLTKSLLIIVISCMAVFPFKVFDSWILNIFLNASIITATFVVFYDYILKRKK